MLATFAAPMLLTLALGAYGAARLGAPPKPLRVFILIVGIIACLVLATSGWVTMRLHTVIEEAVASGGYGPESFSAPHEASWHRSARSPAQIGLIIGAASLYGCFGAWKRTRRASAPTLREWILLGIATTHLGWALVWAVV